MDKRSSPLKRSCISLHQDYRVDLVFLPTCRADDEPVDPKKYLEESCKPKCVKSYLDYQSNGYCLSSYDSSCATQNFNKLFCVLARTSGSLISRMQVWRCYDGDEGKGILAKRMNADLLACAKRVEADETGHKHCTGQYFDYWHCVDKCVAPKLFTKLK
ncbi:hypothetical protein RJ639_010877 [Escallonia herrerae]|uniref:Complex III subunit VI n=1 Tax=Escallonia herrerae TaxID=1293975 RepID=A0AA89ARA6_9ASTE|nr:hypothetical protein RJ639_010877 [Escallonia herrerae]